MTEMTEQNKVDSDNSDNVADGVDEKKNGNDTKSRLWMYSTIVLAVTTIIFMVLYIICVTGDSSSDVGSIPTNIASIAILNVSTQSGNIVMREQGTAALFLPDKSGQFIELKKELYSAPKTHFKVVPDYVRHTYGSCDVSTQSWLKVWSGIVFTGNKNLIRVETDVIVPYPPSGPDSNDISWTFQVWNLGMQPTVIDASIGVNQSYDNACEFQGANETSYINSGHFHRLQWIQGEEGIPETFNPIQRSSLLGKWLWFQNLEPAQSNSYAYGSILNESTYINGESIHTTMIEQRDEVWVTSMQLNEEKTMYMGFNQAVWKNVLRHNYEPGSLQHTLLFNNSWRFAMVPYFYQSIHTQPTLEEIPRFWPNVTRTANISFEVEDNAGLNEDKFNYSPEITGKLFDGHLFLNNSLMDEYVNEQESNATEKFPFQKCVAACVNAWKNGMKLSNIHTNGYDAVVKFIDSVESSACESGVCRVDPSECTLSYWDDFCQVNAQYEWCSQYTT